MTSEICLMNRNAVVLAADSATTVTRFDDDGKKEERYFKGANKIFQLSTHHPVGLMINDSASILRVPWEVAIKEFRRHLGDTSFAGIKGYADAFFQYLGQSTRMFPIDVQDDVFRSTTFSFGLGKIVAALGKLEPGSQESKDAMEALVASIAAQASVAPPHGSLLDADLDGFRQRLLDPLIARFAQFSSGLPDVPMPQDMASFVSSLISIVLSEPANHMGTTGLVFAGFGEDDVFPCITEFQSCGMVASSHIASEVKTTAITHKIPAAISGFAQRSMIETFQMGISQAVYVDISTAIDKGLNELRAAVVGALGTSKVVQKAVERADLTDVFSKSTSAINKAILDQAFADNVTPLRSVLSSLPIDEMAELAESLISLQSLKEKVTKPSETVGGPVDVAVITKAEGLVWMKRKHYFDRELNSRFAYRQQREHR